LRKADVLAKTTGAGLGIGALLGMALAWILFVEHPVISQMIANGPTPQATLITLCDVFASIFAVGAALTAITIDILSGD